MYDTMSVISIKRAALIKCSYTLSNTDITVAFCTQAKHHDVYIVHRHHNEAEPVSYTHLTLPTIYSV